MQRAPGFKSLFQIVLRRKQILLASLFLVTCHCAMLIWMHQYPVHYDPAILQQQCCIYHMTKSMLGACYA